MALYRRSCLITVVIISVMQHNCSSDLDSTYDFIFFNMMLSSEYHVIILYQFLLLLSSLYIYCDFAIFAVISIFLYNSVYKMLRLKIRYSQNFCNTGPGKESFKRQIDTHVRFDKSG